MTYLADTDRDAIAEGLSRVLADSYTLYLKTHNFHWNVTGPMFATLHQMFEQQYSELALAVDEIAERIRALDRPAPGSYRQYAALTSLAEADGVPSAEDMLAQLEGDQNIVANTAREALKAAQDAGDEATGDLLVQRITLHEKSAWMLRSLRG